MDTRESFILLDRAQLTSGRSADAASLVIRAQAGDEDAFALLVGQRENQLYRTAWSFLRNDADALDAAQEACIKAWRELPRLRDPERFDAWLMRGLVNQCRDMLRSRKRQAVREIRMAVDELEPAHETTDAMADELVDSDAIRRAFEQLDAQDRTYIALHYADSRSIAEISAIVGAPEGTVKWRLSRARQALERQLARQTR